MVQEILPYMSQALMFALKKRIYERRYRRTFSKNNQCPQQKEKNDNGRKPPFFAHFEKGPEF